MNIKTTLLWAAAFALIISFALPGIALNYTYADEIITEDHTPAYYLKRVFEIGTQIGNPETLQAILLQESGGKKHSVGNPYAPMTQRSYGLMQLQLSAVKSVLTRNPELLDDLFPNRSLNKIRDVEIANMLITDDDANIRIAALHFNLYLKLSKGNWHRAVAAYNVGIGGVTKVLNPAIHPYVRQVQYKIDRSIKPFNTRNGLLIESE